MPDTPSHVPSSHGSALVEAERFIQSGRVLPVRTVLRLQQTLGNREVVRLLAPRLPAAQAAELLPVPATPAPPLRQRLTAAWGRLSGRPDEKKG
jgi:hypothetical protein